MRPQLLTNQWFGKAIGFTAAFVLAPTNPLALYITIIVGIGVGHLFDLWAGREQANQPFRIPRRKRDAGETPAVNEPHVKFLFTALGHIAKQSGVVTASQIMLAESFIKDLQLGSKGRKEAIQWFNQGKQPNHNLEQLAIPCRGTDPTSKYMHEIAIKCMSQMAARDPSDEALAATVKMAGLLNIHPGLVAKEFGAALKTHRPERPTRQQSQHQEQTNAGATSANAEEQKLSAALAKAYSTLEVSASASKAEAKKAYRRLVNRHHPDKLGPNASPAAIAESEARMIELRQALETIQAN